MSARSDLKYAMMTGGATNEQEAEEMIQAALDEHLAQETDDPSPSIDCLLQTMQDYGINPETANKLVWNAMTAQIGHTNQIMDEIFGKDYRTDQARERAEEAAYKMVGSLFRGELGRNFAKELATKILSAATKDDAA